MADFLWANARFAGQASVSGRLGRLGPYLALVPGGGEVQGELAMLTAPETALPTLDDYEGDGYERVEMPARLADGRQVAAWVYILRRERM